MRVAVVGHVEWVEFARVERVPAPGEIVHASTLGGSRRRRAVAAGQLAKLAGDATFFTALGDDELGRRARELERARRPRPRGPADEPQRRVVRRRRVGERTITVIGDKLVPTGTILCRGELAGSTPSSPAAAMTEALRAARQARVS